MSILTKKAIGAKVTKLANREKVTKELLGELSRDALEYVYASDDIAMVNRLINVLTPVNKKVAIAYFSTFVAWTFDKESLTFGKQQKPVVFKKKSHACSEFLDNGDNNIWTWASTNIEMTVKPKNYSMKIATLVDKALKDEKEGIDLKEILSAVMASDSVNLKDLLTTMSEISSIEAVDVMAKVA